MTRETFKAELVTTMIASNLSNRTKEILTQLKSLGNPVAAEGMARYGINTEHAYGIFTRVQKNSPQDRGKPSDSGSALVFGHS